MASTAHHWNNPGPTGKDLVFRKNKRILWLLNHRTLMPYELPLIRRLGFEVYTPKVIPTTNFRSAAIDFSYDETLTIPAQALATLNEFNFYESEWTPEIVTLLNRYFGTVFVIPHALQVAEAVAKFEGQIVFRAFGLDNEQSYEKVLAGLYGDQIFPMIDGIQERFWFGEGYDNLHEIELPVFQERSIFLPIGLPDSFFENANQWTGKDQRILFVCPFVGSNPYYTSIYEKFKEEFGDLPHIIVGAQDTPTDDPHIAGFVSDEELNRLYLECSVLYYPSRELRHVHYSPIEAAINGMPVVFYADSLLSRTSQGTTKGRVSTVAEARGLIEDILAGDQELIAEIREDQRSIAYHFSDEYCAQMWRQQMDERGFFRALERKPAAAVLGRELQRTAMRPWAQGRTKIDPHRHVWRSMAATLTAEQAKEQLGSSVYDGIRFADPDKPPSVGLVLGMSLPEDWGRWSNSDRVTLVLRHLLAGRFRIFVRAISYLDKVDAQFTMSIDGQRRTFSAPIYDDETIGTWLDFDLKQPSNIIEIEIPEPRSVSPDGRMLGIGLIELRADAPVRRTLEEARAQWGPELADGIDFSADLPTWVEGAEGLSVAEPRGRWSISDVVRINLGFTLNGPVRLRMNVRGYRKNIGRESTVRIGGQVRRFTVPASAAEDVLLDFDLRAPASTIEFSVPQPTRPAGDHRRVGIRFLRLRIDSL